MEALGLTESVEEWVLETLLPKVNLPHAIDLRAKIGHVPP